jgi:hypothetical protein
VPDMNNFYQQYKSIQPWLQVNPCHARRWLFKNAIYFPQMQKMYIKSECSSNLFKPQKTSAQSAKPEPEEIRPRPLL